MPLILRSHKHISSHLQAYSGTSGTKRLFSPYSEKIRPLKENFNEKGRKEVQNTECDMYVLIPMQKLVLASRNILGDRDHRKEEERGIEKDSPILSIFFKRYLFT